MRKKTLFFSRRFGNRCLATIAFALLGVGLNHVSVPLFFGVDFVFGSIASLLAIALVGFIPGLIVALVAASRTYLLWGHPYAAIALVGEALFVGLAWRRAYANIPIAVTIYWILLGIGQVWIYYHFLLGMDEMRAQFAAIKQASNGILNSLIVHLLVSYGPLAKHSLAPIRLKSSVFQSIFGFLSAASVVPALLFFAISSRQMEKEVNESIRLRLDTITRALSLSMENWREQSVILVRTAAAFAEKVDRESATKGLQEILNNFNNSAPDVFGLFVADKNGITKGFSPEINSYGVSNLGLDISDRTYFTKLKDGQILSVSPVFKGRGEYRDPLIVIAHVLKNDGVFDGVAGSAISLKPFQERLRLIKDEGEYRATLLDEFGNVIVSSDEGLHAMDDFRENRLKGVLIDPKGYFHRNPSHVGAPMDQWSDSWAGKKSEIPGLGSWGLVVEVPYEPVLLALYQHYMTSLGMLLLVLCLILMVSFWIALWVSRPLVQFAVQTTDLPDRLSEAGSIRWPRSPFIEFRALVTNMRAMTLELRQKFVDLQKSKEELLSTTASLERVNLLASERAHRQSFLADAGKEIGSSLDTDAIWHRLLGLLVPEWADGVVLATAKGGVFEVTKGKHRESAKEPLWREWFQRENGFSKRFGVMSVISTGESKLLSQINEGTLSSFSLTPREREQWNRLGIGSYLCLPLVIRGKTLGALVAGRDSFASPFSEEDLIFFQELAARASIAVDNAHLYKESQTISRIKDEFLATLSHELRTPLGVILGHAEILKEEGPFGASEVNESVDAIYRNAQVQYQIISDLLDVSAIIAGKMSFHPVETELNAIVKSAVQNVRFASEAKGVVLQADLCDEPLPMVGDPTRLHQICWNLLSNAVKFTPKNGVVKVRTFKEDSRIVFEVSDNGQGIDSEFLPYIFDRFRQEDNSVTRRHGGLGLGLAIVRQLVELHGGQIEALSEGKGKGSIFRARLPLLEASSTERTPLLTSQ